MSECPKHGPYSTPHCRECDLDIIANVESEEPTMDVEGMTKARQARITVEVGVILLFGYLLPGVLIVLGIVELTSWAAS